MTPNNVIRNLSDDELRQSAIEALDWRMKGVLSGQKLRDVAQRLVSEAGVEDFDAPRMAEGLVIEEAAVRYVQQSR